MAIQYTRSPIEGALSSLPQTLLSAIQANRQQQLQEERQGAIADYYASQTRLQEEAQEQSAAQFARTQSMQRRENALNRALERERLALERDRIDAMYGTQDLKREEQEINDLFLRGMSAAGELPPEDYYQRGGRGVDFNPQALRQASKDPRVKFNEWVDQQDISDSKKERLKGMASSPQVQKQFEFMQSQNLYDVAGGLLSQAQQLDLTRPQLAAMMARNPDTWKELSGKLQAEGAPFIQGLSQNLYAQSPLGRIFMSGLTHDVPRMTEEEFEEAFNPPGFGELLSRSFGFTKGTEGQLSRPTGAGLFGYTPEQIERRREEVERRRQKRIDRRIMETFGE